MENTRILLIDDVREYASPCVVARTYRDGILALQHMSPWDELWLDHDLGAIERQYTETGRELTGYDVLCWLEQNPSFLPKKIILVTSNPVGRDRMEKLIKKLYLVD